MRQLKPKFKLIFTFLFLILLALFDELFSLWGCMDFTYQSFGFVPYLTFCGMYILFYDWYWKDQLYIAAFIGLIYDFFFNGMFPVSFILYPLLLVQVSMLRMFIRVDRIQRIVLGCISVFLLEAIPVLFSIAFKILTISLWKWFVYQAVLTVIVNTIFLLIMDYYVVDMQRSRLNQR